MRRGGSFPAAAVKVRPDTCSEYVTSEIHFDNLKYEITNYLPKYFYNYIFILTSKNHPLTTAPISVFQRPVVLTSRNANSH